MSEPQGGEVLREQDRFLPIANVTRIMKRSLPDNAKIAKDAKETVQECVSEFISFITSEASDKCEEDKRKTINGDDILFALQEMGFDNYVEPMRFYLSKYRESQPALDEKNERPVKKRAKKEQDGGGAESSSSSGLPGNAAAAMAMQQQLAMQQMMSMQGLIPGLMPMGMGSGGGELSPEQSAMLAQMQVTGGFGGMPMPPMFATQPPLQQGGPMPTSVVDGSGGENL